MENKEIKVNPNEIKIKDGMFIYGNYVISPQKNAFNELKSYWLTKKLYAVSVYAVSSEADKSITVEEAAKLFEQNIPYLEEVYRKAA